MSRKLSLLFFAASVAFITACSSLTAPVRSEEDEEEPFEETPCSVVGGSQTRCDTTQT